MLVTADSTLRDQVLLLCAAAGVTADLAERLDDAQRRWRSASCVLVGPDAASEASVAGPRPSLPRRDDVVVISDRDDYTRWRDAVAVGAERVLVLPRDQDTVVGWLGDAVDGARSARTFAVVGARGGVGASTLAAALAIGAARRGPTCLVDADPHAGGLELVMGSEEVAGLRWSDVLLSEGRIVGSALRSALPHHRGVAVLSWSRGAGGVIPVPTMRAVVSAVRRVFEQVVLDAPRVLDPAAVEAVAAADRVLLVAGNDVRSVAAASVALPTLRRHAADVALVVRTSPAAAATPESLARALGLRLVGVVPSRRAVRRSVDEGFGPPRRGALAHCCDEILDDVVLAGAA